MIIEEIFLDDRFCQDYCEMTEILIENIISNKAI